MLVFLHTGVCMQVSLYLCFSNKTLHSRKLLSLGHLPLTQKEPLWSGRVVTWLQGLDVDTLRRSEAISSPRCSGLWHRPRAEGGSCGLYPRCANLLRYTHRDWHGRQRTGVGQGPGTACRGWEWKSSFPCGAWEPESPSNPPREHPGLSSRRPGCAHPPTELWLFKVFSVPNVQKDWVVKCILWHLNCVKATFVCSHVIFGFGGSWTPLPQWFEHCSWRVGKKRSANFWSVCESAQFIKSVWASKSLQKCNSGTKLSLQ